MRKADKPIKSLNKELLAEFLKNITKKAGKETLKYFGKAKTKYSKANESDVVTEADLKANKIIVDAIRKNYPGHKVLSEEMEEETITSAYTWIIDPVDGTFNFSKGTPLYGVIVGLMHKEEMLMACIYLPVFDELYFAEKGKGAYKNGKRIRCSDRKEFSHSYGGIGSKISRSRTSILEKLKEESKKCVFWLSALGSKAVDASYVADGRRDWYVTSKGSIWDSLPNVLLMKEAGCKITDFKGKPAKMENGLYSEIIVANPVLHGKILKIMRQ